ncbi:MAG TPA: ribosome maturation factor RimM [Steroidobacteraceae bacterium]|nr:ribosome maturation factor RimM [Steroidobacteraceae bacterium]
MVGRILAPHGVRGAVRVQSYTEPPGALLHHRRWLLRHPDGAEEHLEIRETHPDGRTLRVSLAGVEDRDAAERLRGCDVLLERAGLPPLAAREYYREDLLGFQVRNREGVPFGELVHFLEAPAGALMVVRGERERWLPAGPPCLRRVDLARREIEVDWPPEL